MNVNSTKTGIEIVELNSTDIAREPIISTILDIYNANESEKKIYSPSPIVLSTLISPISPQQVIEFGNIEKNQDAALIPIKDMRRLNGNFTTTKTGTV